MHKEATTCNLRIVKEQWVDKLRYKMVKLEKYMKKKEKETGQHHVSERPESLFQKIRRKEQTERAKARN